MLDNLNPNQLQAVTTNPDKPLLILAGAGSGKTKTLTHRIAWFIQQGINPESILALTFTNKAAKEMSERVEALLQRKLRRNFAYDLNGSPLVCTFHSFGVRFLKHFLTQELSIIDTDDAQKLGKAICEKLNVDHKKWLKAIMSEISRAKNAMEAPGENSKEPLRSIIEKFFTLYNDEKRRLKVFDFDDLLVEPLRVLEANLEVRREINEHFTYILVDEYQDTNKVQYAMLKALSPKHNITAVGDDDQSIYGWRGADITNILNFKKDFTDAEVVKLEQNYRSSQNILDVAYQVISQNYNRHEKKLWTDKGAGELVYLKECFSERNEAEFICKEIKKVVINS